MCDVAHTAIAHICRLPAGTRPTWPRAIQRVDERQPWIPSGYEPDGRSLRGVDGYRLAILEIRTL
jgi:hypothetical protein